MAAALRQQLTPEKAQRFLDALAIYGNVTQAAKSINMARQSLYQRKADDAEFAAKWDVAVKLGAEALEDEARRRAYKGVQKGIFQDGVRVGTVREYSDTLLIFLLKGAMPHKYRDTFHVTGSVAVLGITELLERMRGDSSIAEAAADYVGLIDAPREAGQ